MAATFLSPVVKKPMKRLLVSLEAQSLTSLTHFLRLPGGASSFDRHPVKAGHIFCAGRARWGQNRALSMSCFLRLTQGLPAFIRRTGTSSAYVATKEYASGYQTAEMGSPDVYRVVGARHCLARHAPATINRPCTPPLALK